MKNNEILKYLFPKATDKSSILQSNFSKHLTSFFELNKRAYLVDVSVILTYATQVLSIEYEGTFFDWSNLLHNTDIGNSIYGNLSRYLQLLLIDGELLSIKTTQHASRVLVEFIFTNVSHYVTEYKKVQIDISGSNIYKTFSDFPELSIIEMDLFENSCAELTAFGTIKFNEILLNIIMYSGFYEKEWREHLTFTVNDCTTNEEFLDNISYGKYIVKTTHVLERKVILWFEELGITTYDIHFTD